MKNPVTIETLLTLLDRAEVSIILAHSAVRMATDSAVTANEIVGCIADAPTKLMEAATILEAAIALNRQP